jgi:hypothetical protein
MQALAERLRRNAADISGVRGIQIWDGRGSPLRSPDRQTDEYYLSWLSWFLYKRLRGEIWTTRRIQRIQS